MRIVGIMSGTSLDGMDAVLVEFSTDGSLKTLGMAQATFPEALLSELQALQRVCPNELERAHLAANELANCYARLVIQLLKETSVPADQIRAICAHGQTVRHQPQKAYSVQLLNGALLAELTHIDVICDVRSADIAAGGQGAPLVPAFHHQVFTRADCARDVVNIGGIANVTHLASKQSSSTVFGYDTGPGNTLLDQWCKRHTGKDFDESGHWSRNGKVNTDLLKALLGEAFFSAPPPKSTGRDLFHLPWLEERLRLVNQTISPIDVQATLTELTAASITNVLKANEVFLCGGGVFNTHLMERLRALNPLKSLSTTNVLGIAPQAVEATAFAWLGYKRLRLQTNTLASVTGAKGPRVSGALHPCQPRD